MSVLSSKAEKFAKKAEDFPSIFGGVNLTSIRENIGEILKFIGRDGIFREYTLHDANHIDAMLALVDKLIPAETAKQMKTADWLLIVLSCYFHDLGMLVTKKEFENRNNGTDFPQFRTGLLTGDKGKDYEEALSKLSSNEKEEFLYQEFVRKNHAKRISLWIQGQDARQYGDAKAAVETVNKLLGDLEQVVRDDLAKICQSHHEEDLFDLDKYKIKRVYGDKPEGVANLHYAALILRTADILQIQKKRVPPVLYKLIDPSNPKSQEEWAKQAGVRAVTPRVPSNGSEPDTIEIHAQFEKESAYFGLLAYLQQFAGKELERCHEWSKQAEKSGATYKFPWRKIDSSQVEPRGFEGRSYSFTLDQEKILKLLTGHTLYNDYRVAIREVLQNALDAVRFRKFLNKDEPMGKIEIIWNSKTRKLIVRDTGVGMTQETIEKFLLNVGSSYYQSEAVLQKYTGFSSISRFGIGVLSTFMIADEVQILTVHPDDEFARRLTLPSVVKSYLIKKFTKGDAVVQPIGPHGTEVTLQIRRSAKLNDVEALLRYWLVIPNCEVTYKIDDGNPMRIGFDNAKDVVSHYYQKEVENVHWKSAFEVRTESEPGIELAFVVSKSDFGNVWDFAKTSEYRRRNAGMEEVFYIPPGMCVEGIRVRSVPPGYNARQSAPWAFVNLTGHSAPKTNVARSDVEQTPELETALYKIYSLLGNHVQNEFNRLIENQSGIVEAAREADLIRRYGLEVSPRSNPEKFAAATNNLRIIAMEDKNSCHAITNEEFEALDEVWTVDSRLARNIEGISGPLGINLPADKIITALGKTINPNIPLPRLLGSSKSPLSKKDAVKFRIYPEERTHRIDIMWGKEKPDRWIEMPEDLRQHVTRGSENNSPTFEAILISKDSSVSSECSSYDIITWRGWCFILTPCVVSELLNVLGMNERFAQILGRLIGFGQISNDEKTVLKEHLGAEKGNEELLKRLVLPFNRRFGDVSRSQRISHFFHNDW